MASHKKASDIENGLKKCRTYWDERAGLDASETEKVEMSPRTQACRFEMFLRDHDIAGKRILEVGCGTGGFYKHLLKRNIECHYEGFDLSPQMVELCRGFFPGIPFYHGDVLKWETDEPFDYTVSFAIHNIKIPQGWEILQAVTRRQFELCRVAAHLSILTDRFQGFGEKIQAWRAEDVLTFALSLTPYVDLRHSYLPNDFNLTLYREPLIDTCKDLMLE